MPSLSTLLLLLSLFSISLSVIPPGWKNEKIVPLRIGGGERDGRRETVVGFVSRFSKRVGEGVSCREVQEREEKEKEKEKDGWMEKEELFNEMMQEEEEGSFFLDGKNGKRIQLCGEKSILYQLNNGDFVSLLGKRKSFSSEKNQNIDILFVENFDPLSSSSSPRKRRQENEEDKDEEEKADEKAEELRVGVFLVRLNDHGTQHSTCSTSDLSKLIWGEPVQIPSPGSPPISRQETPRSSLSLSLSNFSFTSSFASSSSSLPPTYFSDWSVRSFFVEQSGGSVTVSCDQDHDGNHDIFDNFIVSYHQQCDPDQWRDRVLEQAYKRGIPVHLFTHRIFVLSPSPEFERECGWKGLGTLSCQESSGVPCDVWTFGCPDFQVFAHELGHNIGMGHATSFLEEYREKEEKYGDPEAIMGNSFLQDHRLTHLTSPHVYDFQWLPSYLILSPSLSNVYLLGGIDREEGWNTFVREEGIRKSGVHVPLLMKISHPDIEMDYFFSFYCERGREREKKGEGVGEKDFGDVLLVHSKRRESFSATSYLVAVLNFSTFETDFPYSSQCEFNDTCVDNIIHHGPEWFAPTFVDFANRFSVGVLSYQSRVAKIDVAFECIQRDPLFRFSVSTIDQHGNTISSRYTNGSTIPFALTTETNFQYWMTNMDSSLCDYSVFSNEVSLWRCGMDDFGREDCTRIVNEFVGASPSTISLSALQTCSVEVYGDSLLGLANRIQVTTTIDSPYTAEDPRVPERSFTTYMNILPAAECKRKPLKVDFYSDIDGSFTPHKVEMGQRVVTMVVQNQDSLYCSPVKYFVFVESPWGEVPITFLTNQTIEFNHPAEVQIVEIGIHSLAGSLLHTEPFNITVAFVALDIDNIDVVTLTYEVILCERWDMKIYSGNNKNKGELIELVMNADSSTRFDIMVENTDRYCPSRLIDLSLITANQKRKRDENVFQNNSGNGASLSPPDTLTLSPLSFSLSHSSVILPSSSIAFISLVVTAPKGSSHLESDVFIRMVDEENDNKFEGDVDLRVKKEPVCVLEEGDFDIICPYDLVDVSKSSGSFDCQALIWNKDSRTCPPRKYTLVTFPPENKGWDATFPNKRRSITVDGYPPWKNKTTIRVKYPRFSPEEDLPSSLSSPFSLSFLASVPREERGVVGERETRAEVFVPFGVKFGICNPSPPTFQFEHTKEKQRKINSLVGDTISVYFSVRNNDNIFCGLGASAEYDMEIDIADPNLKEFLMKNKPSLSLPGKTTGTVELHLIPQKEGIYSVDITLCERGTEKCGEVLQVVLTTTNVCLPSPPLVTVIPYNYRYIGSTIEWREGERGQNATLQTHAAGLPFTSSFFLQVENRDIASCDFNTTFTITLSTDEIQNPNSEYFTEKGEYGNIIFQMSCDETTLNLPPLKSGKVSCSIEGRGLMAANFYSVPVTVSDSMTPHQHTTIAHLTLPVICPPPTFPGTLSSSSVSSTLTSLLPTAILEWQRPYSTLSCCEGKRCEFLISRREAEREREEEGGEGEGGEGEGEVEGERERERRGGEGVVRGMEIEKKGWDVVGRTKGTRFVDQSIEKDGVYYYYFVKTIDNNGNSSDNAVAPCATTTLIYIPEANQSYFYFVVLVILFVVVVLVRFWFLVRKDDWKDFPFHVYQRKSFDPDQRIPGYY